MATVIETKVTSKIHWMAPLQALDKAIASLEDIVIAILVFAMLILGSAQIVMWNLFHQGLPWVDPLLRHLVLWVAMVGASMATSARRHLNMDTVIRLLPPRGKAIAGILVELSSAIIIGILAWVSCIFIGEEMSSGTHAFLNVERWQAELILPIAFGTMSYRFLLAAIEDLRNLLCQQS